MGDPEGMELSPKLSPELLQPHIQPRAQEPHAIGPGEP